MFSQAATTSIRFPARLGKIFSGPKVHRPTNNPYIHCIYSSISRGGGNLVDDLENEDESLTTDSYQNVYVAVGSNMGDKFNNFMTAISMLEETSAKHLQRKFLSPSSEEPLIRLVRTSFLRETAPMYVTDQPSFLNGAVELRTKLTPHTLLRRLKDIEKSIGRDLDHGIRFGPRPIDLDIIYYGVKKNSDGKSCDGGIIFNSTILQIPHPRIQERKFVLSPLLDLNHDIQHPFSNFTPKEMLFELSNNSSAEGDEVPSVQVLPLPRGRMLAFNQTHIMGILNVTPDSFSDGGKYKNSADLAVQEALKLVKDGATIIDIGGESTRPGAKEVEVDIQLNRTIPVIRKLREVSDIPISIDTRHSQVAKAAIEAGADIVNDVSGGTFDPLMFQTVAELRVPIVIMHMRGTPETMQRMTLYGDVVTEVATALKKQSEAAEECGIPRWLQVLDPGIGFAKDLDHNLSLLKHSSSLRNMVGGVPLLLGPSRKGFIGKISGETAAEERDYGTLASCLAGIVDKNGNLAPTILRVHNVKGVVQGVRIMEAIINAK